MAYNVAQIRRQDIIKYSTPVDYSNLEDVDIYEGDTNFRDLKLTINNNPLSVNYSYYLKIAVREREDSAQSFSIILENADNEQIIKDLKVNKKEVIKRNASYSTFEFIFTPNSNYTEMFFKLDREIMDWNTTGEYADPAIIGRKLDVQIIELYKIDNIIDDFLSNKFGLTVLNKIGIQGPPGLLFTLDGEEVRIGKTGIYELYNENISVKYLGFILNDNDFFLLDFKY